MIQFINFKYVVLVLSELALLAVFVTHQASAFSGIFNLISSLVGFAILLGCFIFWRLHNPKITQVVVRKSNSFVTAAACLGIVGFLFPVLLGSHATLGMLLLGLVAQICCLLVASYVTL